jgi:hypothetical protein
MVLRNECQEAVPGEVKCLYDVVVAASSPGCRSHYELLLAGTPATSDGLEEESLGLDGVSVATEAEMEYATRAGALTSRYYGETEELLPKYAWYSKNSQEKTWPVGSLKPNDFGLFDMQGNVLAWCQERYGDYPPSQGKVIEDKEDNLIIDNQYSRVLRSASFNDPASTQRSSFRLNTLPAFRHYVLGFRLARTFAP